ncbi:hypothetical protein QBC37DRAFT_189872 [Rhypophila decipiens]|uniref:Transmembrane protein n=1 Tax=Rhypophila decipiens TaxID=261697 RepID=A0AAN6YIZ0_9PEZI|nr:hypothetical protein QBC37DRAFT_189872 [Rhypophila decipiens]
MATKCDQEKQRAFSPSLHASHLIPSRTSHPERRRDNIVLTFAFSALYISSFFFHHGRGGSSFISVAAKLPSPFSNRHFTHGLVGLFCYVDLGERSLLTVLALFCNFPPYFLLTLSHFLFPILRTLYFFLSYSFA